MSDAEHFPGCHPEDAKAPDRPEPGDGPGQDVECCWHCGTPTSRGDCGCEECWDGGAYIPLEAMYHCQACGRWWAWMTGLNITTITFGEGDKADA